MSDEMMNALIKTEKIAAAHAALEPDAVVCPVCSGKRWVAWLNFFGDCRSCFSFGKVAKEKSEVLRAHLNAAKEADELFKKARKSDSTRDIMAENVFTTVDADRLLGLADQFLEDWEQEGRGDSAYVERRKEYDAIRPIFVAAPAMLTALENAIKRIEIANQEGNPILSAWLLEARAALPSAGR